MRLHKLVACLMLPFLCALNAHAHEESVQRELIRRDQQADAFALELRAQQERLRPAARAEAAQLEQRRFERAQRLEQISAEQLRSGPVAAGQPHARELAAQERRSVFDMAIEPPPRAVERAVRPLPLTP